MADILVVEDEDIIRTALRRLLERHSYKVSEAATVSEAQNRFDLDAFDLIISDLRLPGAPGTDLITLAEDVPVLIMTSYASLRSAVDSMKMGAVDYIAKPFNHDEMLAAIARILQKREREGPPSRRRSGRRGQPQLGGMIGSCRQMQTLYEHIARVAPTDTTVLIHGETGTGKELVARALHQQSQRADKELVCVNCAAIPETLIESELFGYEKGAFTGANATRMGLIEAADGGTLFLDEIGELPLEAQARLLRFIQENEIRRIGSVQSRKVDVRLICATHRNLKALAARGSFREDLYYRINVMRLELPPLRERGKDILEIAESLLAQRCEALDRPPVKLSPKAVQAITTYRWPGNVRELENALQRAVILCDGDEIDNELLSIDLELVNVSEMRPQTAAPPRAEPPARSENRAGDYPGDEEDAVGDNVSLEDYFQRFVLEHQDSMSETELAKKLGVSRKCLWERRQRLGIPRRRSAARDAK